MEISVKERGKSRETLVNIFCWIKRPSQTDLLIFNNHRLQNIVVRYLSRHGINDTPCQREDKNFESFQSDLLVFECTRRKREIEKEREELISLAAKGGTRNNVDENFFA